jgi:ATP/ADP translocase
MITRQGLIDAWDTLNDILQMPMSPIMWFCVIVCPLGVFYMFGVAYFLSWMAMPKLFAMHGVLFATFFHLYGIVVAEAFDYYDKKGTFN